MSTVLPTLFVSHGAPTLPLEEVPTRAFLAELGHSLGRPAAILAVSAHWATPEPAVSSTVEPPTIHDFYGFPDALYRLHYPAAGAPELAARAASLLEAEGLAVSVEAQRGLDHGTWVPLMLMYPQADIPVTQLSVQAGRDPAHHHRVGLALESLRREGVLVLGSGGAVHNLGAVRFAGGETPDWASGFDEWLTRVIEGRHLEALLSYRRSAPHASQAHPTDEHLLPLFVALGAAGPQARGYRIHGGFSYGSLSMTAYRFE